MKQEYKQIVIESLIKRKHMLVITDHDVYAAVEAVLASMPRTGALDEGVEEKADSVTPAEWRCIANELTEILRHIASAVKASAADGRVK